MSSWFSGLFLDSTPSIVAAVAIFTTIALFVVTILVSGGSASITQKLGSSVLLFLVLLPSIGLSLFDITCLMRGGDKSLCGILGWVKALLIVLYTGLIAIMTVMILLYGKQLRYDGFKNVPGGKRRVKFTDLADVNFGPGADQKPVYVGPLNPLNKETRNELDNELNEGFVGGSSAADTGLPAPKTVAAAAVATTAPTQAVAPTVAGASAPGAGSVAHAAVAKHNAGAKRIAAFTDGSGDVITDLAGGLGTYLTGKDDKREEFFGGAPAPVPLVGGVAKQAPAMAAYPF